MATLAPFFASQFFDNDGAPLAGGKVYTYAAGTSTPLATYTNAGAGTPNANPVVLDANGRAAIWLSNSAYKFVLKDSSDATISTDDNVSLFGDAPSAIYRWAGTAGGSANTITLTPAITITAYAAGQRFAFICATANTSAATVNVSSLGAKNVITLSGSALVGGEMIVGGIYDITYDGTNFYLNETVPDSSVTRAKLSAGAMSANVKAKTTTYPLTSADDIILCSASGGAWTATLPTAVGVTGKMYLLKKTDSSANAVTIATTSSQTIDGVTSLKLAAQYDFLKVVSDGSNWMIVDSKTTSEVWLNTANGHGAVNTKIRIFTTTVVNIGSAITYATSANSGASFTINENGVYSISFGDGSSVGDYTCISLNSNQLTTGATTITAAHRLAMQHNMAGVDPGGNTSVSKYLVIGDVIRPHTNGNNDSTTASQFVITKVR